METVKPETRPPLAGVRVVEFDALGPAPLCCMLLSDMGAEIVRIARDDRMAFHGPIARGRHELVLDLKSPEGRERALAAIDAADVLVEGYRPGVMERLGLGPEIARARNPRLIYARMTGWGQDGPLAHAAGHDINYIAITGALAAIGPAGQPSPPPLNLVGDYGGGGLYLAFGITAALLERERSGEGQVIDAAIVDGTASMMAVFAGRVVSLEKPLNPLGGAAPYYRCYICADGRQIAVGAIEPQFYAELTRRIGAPELPNRDDPANWPEVGRALEALFATRAQAEWCELLEGTDACFAPVLPLDEAASHPQMASRGAYLPRGDGIQPAPAPRFSRTPGAIQEDRSDGAEVIARWRGEAGPGAR